MKPEVMLQTSPEANADSGPQVARLWFLTILALIAVGSLLIRLYVSSAGYIDFEEWQHVFQASTARWSDLRFELDADAHPPLFILLLRFLLHFGHSKLLYRSISICSGTASVVLVGLIARKVCRNSLIALLCAAAFGFSAAAISISSQIRSYQLAICFVLLAFLSYLEMLSESNNKLSARPYVVFAIASSAAVLSDYVAGLFLCVCIILTFLLILFRRLRPAKVRLSPSAGSRPLLFLSGSIALPLCIFGYLYTSHASKQPVQGYLYDFYYGFGPSLKETRLAFTFRNLQNLWNLFSPVTFHHRPPFLLTLAVLCVAAVYILIKHRYKRSPMEGRTNLPVLYALAMVFELAILSLEKKYPFGGLMRHQYIVAPFLTIAFFVLLDRAVFLITPRLKIPILILVAASIAANAAVSWPHLVVGRGFRAYQSEFDYYRAAFPSARAVYLDGFGIIDYFSNTDEKPRTFVRHISDEAFIDQYRIEGDSREGVQIFYDKSRANLDLSDPGLYASLASCLRQSGVKEVTLFYLSPGNVPLRQGPELLKRTIANAAAAQGLKATKIAIGGIEVCAGFTLNPTAGSNGG